MTRFFFGCPFHFIRIKQVISPFLSMPQMADLSQELLLQIVECLIEGDELDPSRGGKEIANDSSEVIRGLSRTSTYFYKLLSPYIFQQVVMRNTQKSGDSLQFLAGTSQSANVKVLHFKASASDSEIDDGGEIETDLQPSVHTILSDLASFPKLRTLIVDFDVEKIQDRDFEELIQEDDDDQETEEQIIEAEGKQSWRALQKQIFDAISKKKSSHIRHVVVKTCPLKATSLYGSEQMNKVRASPPCSIVLCFDQVRLPCLGPTWLHLPINEKRLVMPIPRLTRSDSPVHFTYFASLHPNPYLDSHHLFGLPWLSANPG